MLTGDKMETAENIAKSCKLIQPDFQILRFGLPKLSFTGEIGHSHGKESISADVVLTQLSRLKVQAM
jgi:magnesium-transporting ATPase (P-type)